MSEPAASPKSPLIVYVDDERANRVVFEQTLAHEFNLLCAADAPSAITLLEQHEVAVLITDMRMPTMSGGELLRIAKERWPGTTRMVITAYADVDPILRAINEGLVARYMIKPWQRAELVQVLRWAIEAWRLSRDSAAIHRRLLETERLATLGSVTGMLIHDLRQPLMSLTVNIDHLRELATATPMLRDVVSRVQLPPEQHARVAQLVEDLEPLAADLRTSVDHLGALITSLREFGRGRAANDGPAPATDLLPILRHAMAVCQDLAIHAQGSMEYRGPVKLPHVRMAPTELTQVLINVLANGAQAIGARGQPNGHVAIFARAERDTVELQIRDDGVGMAPDVLERIGTPFYTTRAEGTGLGIAQCQRLVGTAGGRLRIESEVGVGTTVTIVLPTAA